MSRLCIVCKERFDEEDNRDFGPDGPYCSDHCVGRRRAELFNLIPAKHGITKEQFEAILADFHNLPSYGRR